MFGHLNSYFASVFAHETPPPFPLRHEALSMRQLLLISVSELTIKVSEVQSVLEALDVMNAALVNRELQAHLLTVTGMSGIQSLGAMCI